MRNAENGGDALHNRHACYFGAEPMTGHPRDKTTLREILNIKCYASAERIERIRNSENCAPTEFI